MKDRKVLKSLPHPGPKSCLAPLMLSALLAIILTLPAHGADKFPAHPVKIVITHAAGTSNDIEVRAVQPYLQKQLGVPVVIENMPGTAGRKSREYVMKEKPDGYTLLSTGMPSCQIGEILYKGRYETLKFTHIFSLFGDANVLFVKGDSPYKDMATFLEKHKGKTLTCGTPGVGSPSQLDGMSLTRHLGLTARWIPYDGGTEALSALAGGHVDYVIGNIGGSAAMLSSKVVRILMTFSDKRDPRHPEVPTYKDLGYSINFNPPIRGIVGPPGIPTGVVKTLETAFGKAAKTKEFLALTAKADLITIPRGAQEFLAISKNTWEEIKGQEAKLRALIEPKK